MLYQALQVLLLDKALNAFMDGMITNLKVKPHMFANLKGRLHGYEYRFKSAIGDQVTFTYDNPNEPEFTCQVQVA